MFRYLFFDFDGTLYDTVEGCFAGPPLDDKFVEKFGFSREDAEQAVRDFRERYVPIGLYESRAFPGLKELLRELRAAGYRLAVTTSKPQVLAEELLRREELYELFDCVCGAAEEGEGNAKWQVLRRAMEKLQAPEGESVLIGDTKYDVAGAKRCGIPCIGVGYGYAAPGELEQAGADAIASDLSSLRSILLS